MESRKSDWERVSPTKLGEGGQSEVYLVRSPERTKQRASSREILVGFEPLLTGTAESISEAKLQNVEAIREYIRPDLPEELGAMKEFKLRDNVEQSLKRLQQEIDVLAGC